jgi:putative nucleotide binding protein
MSHEPTASKRILRGPRSFRGDGGPRGGRGFHGSSEGRRPERPERPEVKHTISGPVEEAVYVLDILPTGNPMDRLPSHLRVPIIIGIGNKFFSLLEVEIKRKNPDFKLQQKLSLEKTEESPLKSVKRRIKFEELSPTAKNLLESTIEHIVRDDEHRFVEFFNNARPITTRKHQLQLLPGVGKKILWDFINAHKQKAFESFQDIQARVNVTPIPILAKRIIEELETIDEKYRLFTRSPPSPSGPS